ncbi:hypothetical protein [Streptomyces sp. NPDC005012]|uniref:hypothetical protein n=1 Tax=Streptomyces sp. NPDC005012 TaxID=3154558 RepID=UPI0033B1241B
MAAEQLPGRVRDFARYLEGLLGRVDQRAGWSGVFWERHPEGMRACLEGRDVPPWDVVEGLLHDLAAAHGSRAAAVETEPARALHAAAATAHDTRPGGREALRDRLEAAWREEREAAGRRAERGRAVEAAGGDRAPEALRVDLAWARDDHERAVARCAELRARWEALDRGERAEPARVAGAGEGAGAAGRQKRKRPRGSARFAGMLEEPDVQAAPAPPAGPFGPVPAAAPAPFAAAVTGPGSGPVAGLASGFGFGPEPGRAGAGAGIGAPRGARFAGATEEPAAGVTDAPGPEDRRLAAEQVARLLRLRAQGRSGEAHALLAETASWPPARLPLVAEELARSRDDVEWTTLLWEVSSLPVARLVPVGDALAAAGRGEDGERVLRQGVARAAEEMGGALLSLAAAGRHRDVRLLLDAYVRVRAPAEVVRCVLPDPDRLVPLLLAAGRGVSDDHHWSLIHALRVTGIRGV